MAAVALAVALFALTTRGSSSAGAGGAADLPMAAGATDATAAVGRDATTGTSPSSDEVVVQVAGAVVHPGVFHLPSGARLGDLVDRAGGLSADADTDRIDLAARLVDGSLVYVPHRGEAEPPGPVVGQPGADVSSSASGGGSGPAVPVDLNTATADQLDTLPGVGPATAATIIAFRRQHGPFRTVDDLAAVSGIGPAKLAQIRPHVRV